MLAGAVVVLLAGAVLVVVLALTVLVLSIAVRAGRRDHLSVLIPAQGGQLPQEASPETH